MKVIDKDAPDAFPIDTKMVKPLGSKVLSENQFSAERITGHPASISRPARFGHLLKNHPKTVSCLQWSVVCLYLALLLGPVWLSDNGTRQFSRLLFWGVGWPGIVLSMLLFGRFWCGLFCPDGTLTELISHYGKKKSIPRWIRWKGWPCTVLVGTTLYGQLIGVYDRFPASLVLLGIPTCCALLTGYLYGNGKRIWCMYLCPGNGFFGFLATLSPFHFRVDKTRWKRFEGATQRVNCAPLINIGQMQSASACHACGRCSGYRDAVELAMRPPSNEILSANPGDFSNSALFLLMWGVIGIGTMALAWRNNALYSFYLTYTENWPGITDLPWWIAQDAISVYRLFFIVAAGSLVSLIIYTVLRTAAFIAGNDFLWKSFAYCLIPVACWGIFLGLCRISAAAWQEYGYSFAWLAFLEPVIVTGASLFSIRLGIKTLGFPFTFRRFSALLIYATAVVLLSVVWL